MTLRRIASLSYSAPRGDDHDGGRANDPFPLASVVAGRPRSGRGARIARALSGAANIFTDYHHETALLKFAQALTSVKLALAPLLSGAALVLAVLGRLRQAILALAALILMSWLLDDVSSIAIHGLEFTPDFGGAMIFGKRVIMPVLAAAAAAWAWQDRRLRLACLFVSLPTIANWVGVVIFTVSILMYGF
jgi:hypothetical protein